MARSWTEKQLEAIEDRSGDLLVSAAAGSGKTAVLVERITRLILADHVPVTNMLVVTFTKAAASEMRERIQKSLRDALSSSPDSEIEAFLRTQLSSLNRASITNFHSFASSLLREFFQVAGVDPAFRVADETESSLLKADAMDELFETRFLAEGKKKDDFIAYLSTYGTSRSEEAVKDRISFVSTYLDSLPDPDKWLETAASFASASLPEFASSEIFRFVETDIEDRLSDAVKASDSLIRFLDSNPVYKDNLRLLAGSERDALLGIQDAFRRSFDEGVKALKNASFARFAAKAKEKESYAIDSPYISRLRAVYHCSSPKGIVETLESLYGMRTLSDAHSLIQGTGEYCRILTELVAEFRVIYRKKKDAEKLLDFADLESFALSVLSDEPTLETLRSRFRYIFVDEYQDSNRVQEELITRLKTAGNSLFFVGDIKQSIYRFRLAEPTIFNQRMKRYRALDSGKVIDLNRNFRSENSILTAVNSLFGALMEPTVSGILYDESQALFPGTDSQEKANTPVELHLIDPRWDETASGEPKVDLKSAEAEALLAADLIRNLVGKSYIDFSTGEEKTLALSDIVILLRAGTNAGVFEEALLGAGFGAVTDSGNSYFDTIEISILLSLLEIIDNLHRDEALISVLHSSLFRFSPDELAEIRLCCERGSFADALLRAGKQDDSPLALRIRSFLDTLRGYREKARFLSLTDFLWSLMIESGYYYYIGALPGGLHRQANLRALVEKAASFEANGGKGLPGWIRFVNQMKKGKLQVPEVKPSVGENAVRIMTIHKSKGLEFPVVILPELGKRMNQTPSSADLPLRPEGILALPYVDKTRHMKSKTLLQTAVERMQNQEERAEELRVLYVALTRAKHKLILTGTAKDTQLDDLDAGRISAGGDVMTAASYLDWMLGSAPFLAKVGKPVLHSLSSFSREQDSADYHNGLYYDALETGFTLTGEETDGDFVRELTKRMNWVYPYEKDSATQSKMTVTEINRKKEGALPFRIPLAVPSFIRKDKKRVFTGAEKGTLLHSVLEHIPFRNGWTDSSVSAFISDMKEREFFTEEEAAEIPPDKIRSFFESPIGQRAIKAAGEGNLFRETDFTLLVEDGVTVQGTIDLFFRDDAGWVLVDYKTNYLDGSEASEEALLDSYRSQLLLYKKALEQIRGISVTETYLYAFSRGKALRLY